MMKNKLIILAIIALIVAGIGFYYLSFLTATKVLAAEESSTQSALTPISNMAEVSLRGVYFSPFNDEQASQEIIDNSLRAIREQTGANSISVIVQWFQDDINSTEISPRKNDYPVQTISDDKLAYLVQAAHKQGMRVLLYPLVGVAAYWDPYPHPVEQSWTEIRPSQEWWDSYQRFIIYYATFAEKYGVDMLMVHSELPKTNENSDKWRSIIKEVRGIYKGQVGAGVLLWDLIAVYPWMSDLDFIGTGFGHGFNTNNPDMTVQEMLKEISTGSGDLKMLSYVRRLYEPYKKPIIFTEVVNPSYDGATAGGFSLTALEEGKVNPDLQEQADFYEAFFRAYYKKPWVVGAFMGDWFVGDEDPCQAQRDPQNWGVSLGIAYKPAANVIRHWFTQPDRLTAQPMDLKPDGHVDAGETDPEKILKQFDRQCSIPTPAAPPPPDLTRFTPTILLLLVITGVVVGVTAIIRKIRKRGRAGKI